MPSTLRRTIRRLSSDDSFFFSTLTSRRFITTNNDARVRLIALSLERRLPNMLLAGKT